MAGSSGGRASTQINEFEMKHTSNEGYKFNYANYGLDWTTVEGLEDADNQCGSHTNQSPVNLMHPIGSYGWAYGLPLPKADD